MVFIPLRLPGARGFGRGGVEWTRVLRSRRSATNGLMLWQLLSFLAAPPSLDLAI